MKTLTDNFINELFKICLRNKKIFELTRLHLKYNYLPSEQYKEIWQSMTNYFDTTEKLLTIGLLTQTFENKIKTIGVINEIKKAETPDPEDVLHQLETFIKNKIFIETYEQLHDLFNKNDKQGAFELMGDTAEKLKEFTIDNKKAGSKIFADYFKRIGLRNEGREVEEYAQTNVKGDKIPTGIIPLDRITRGGIDRGDTLLILADSGVGKSKKLKHIGLSAARRGFRVVHVQAEGTKKEAEDAYDAAIAGKPVSDIELGNLKSNEIEKIKQSVELLRLQGGEIHTLAFEQFDNGSMRDVHTFCQEISDKYGQIDLLLVDYLDEVDPGDGRRYPSTQDGTRLSRRASAKKFKNICVEFDCAGATATQASDIKDKDKEDPTFTLKRGNISENRKLLQPFSYLISLNRTSQEERENVMRLYVDKIRKYGIKNRTIYIATNYNVERFYDHKSTVNKFGDYEIE